MDMELLYVSRSKLRLPQEEAEVDAIVDWSRGRNAEFDVTGALIFTETHFAQFLEGPEAGVDALMASIARDPRHTDLQIMFRRPTDERRFPTWSLAYAGPSTFVAGHVLSVGEAGATPAGLKAADRLVSVMRQFVAAQLKEQERKRAR
jgi:hypothetical protein